MTFFKKAIRFLIGLVLLTVYRRRLDLNAVVRGKRVVVMGAASSAYENNDGADIDTFDVVIRINKAPALLRDGKWADRIGTRADILFHSFFENEKSGGGPLDLLLFDKLGIKYLINPIGSYAGFRSTLNFYKKYLSHRIVYKLSQASHIETVTELGDFTPTIGFCALKACLESDPSELYITGFTFFKTAFAAGYRDTLREAEQIQKYLKDAGLHDPDREFEYFKRLLDRNTQKNIRLDSTLQAIVDSDPTFTKR